MENWMLKFLAWAYAIIGSAYYCMWLTEPEGEVLHRHAVGPLYFLMSAAPFCLMFLIAQLIMLRGRGSDRR